MSGPLRGAVPGQLSLLELLDQPSDPNNPNDPNNLDGDAARSVVEAGLGA